MENIVSSHLKWDYLLHTTHKKWVNTWRLMTLIQWQTISLHPNTF